MFIKSSNDNEYWVNWIFMHRDCPKCGDKIIRNNTVGTECSAMYCDYIESDKKLDK